MKHKCLCNPIPPWILLFDCKRLDCAFLPLKVEILYLKCLIKSFMSIYISDISSC